MSPYECYITYLSIKQHFTSESYDFFTYNAKVRSSVATYNKRKDRFFFEKLSRNKTREEIINYFVASFVVDPDISKVWVGDLKEKGEYNYSHWKERNNNLLNLFQSELNLLTKDQTLYESISFELTSHPLIIKKYMKGEVSIETLTILNNLCSFIKENEYDPVMKIISFKVKKYSPFLRYDKNEFLKVIKEVMNE